MSQYAVIGHPIKHSLSPELHQQFAKQTGIKLTYEKIEAPLEGFDATVKQFIAQGGRGLNVTVPFKEQAFELVDRLDVSAQQAGAVNVIAVENAALTGYNTDGAGLVQDIKYNLNTVITDRSILLIGAGGAAKGALPSLLAEHPKQMVIVNRTHSKATALAEQYATQSVEVCDFDTLKGHQFDIVINATTSSLSNIELPLPAALFSDHALSYDMVYSQEPTAFMQWSGKQHASIVSDGFGMLVEQAALSFEIWHGIEPDTSLLIKTKHQ